MQKLLTTGKDIMDISEIKQIVKLMEAKGLTEFSFKDDNREFLFKTWEW